MASSAGMRPKSAEDSEELQTLYNQVWAAFTEESNTPNDGDLDNIYGGYTGGNDAAHSSAVPQPPPLPPKRA